MSLTIFCQFYIKNKGKGEYRTYFFFLFQILQCVPFIPNSAILFYQIVIQSIKCKSITKMKSNHYH